MVKLILHYKLATYGFSDELYVTTPYRNDTRKGNTQFDSDYKASDKLMCARKVWSLEIKNGKSKRLMRLFWGILQEWTCVQVPLV